MAGPGVGIGDDDGEPGVQRLALQRVEPGEHHRGEQRVREAHHEVVTDNEQVLRRRGRY